MAEKYGWADRLIGVIRGARGRPPDPVDPGGGETAMGRLGGKVAIVTGAARGTGEATARLFVRGGRARRARRRRSRSPRGGARRSSARRRRSNASTYLEDDWARAVEATAAREFGAIDVLVNNAAVLHMAAIEDTGLAEFERVVRVNQLGTFLGIKAVAPVMKGADAARS